MSRLKVMPYGASATWKKDFIRAEPADRKDDSGRGEKNYIWGGEDTILRSEAYHLYRRNFGGSRKSSRKAGNQFRRGDSV